MSRNKSFEVVSKDCSYKNNSRIDRDTSGLLGKLYMLQNLISLGIKTVKHSN